MTFVGRVCGDNTQKTDFGKDFGAKNFTKKTTNQYFTKRIVAGVCLKYFAQNKIKNKNVSKNSSHSKPSINYCCSGVQKSYLLTFNQFLKCFWISTTTLVTTSFKYSIILWHKIKTTWAANVSVLLKGGNNERQDYRPKLKFLEC